MYPPLVVNRWFPVAVIIATAAASLGHGDGGCCDDHGEDEDEQFICDATEDLLTPGTDKTGATYTVTILEAIPVEHSVQGEDDVDGDPSGLNQLRVSITDDQDVAVEGATFDRIEPFTARHDHGTPIPATWSELGGGEYQLSSINYVHRGPWRLTLEIDVGGAKDTTAFVFCIRDFGFEDGGVGGL